MAILPIQIEQQAKRLGSLIPFNPGFPGSHFVTSEYRHSDSSLKPLQKAGQGIRIEHV